MAVTSITNADIARSAAMNDLDEACAFLQGIAKVTDGGIAGMVFADIDWKAADQPTREAKIRRWIEVEKLYE